MKKLIIISMLLFSGVAVRAQISDELLQDTIDLWIVPNNAKSITAAKMNTILTWLNTNKLHVDSAYWVLRGSSDDTITAPYNVYLDSAFMMKAGPWYLGYQKEDTHDDNADSLVFMGYSDYDGSGKVATVEVRKDDSDTNYYIYLYNSSAKGYTYLKQSDTNIVINGPLELPNLQASARVGSVLVTDGANKNVHEAGLATFADSLAAAWAATPTPYATWVRDPTAGVLSPANAGDTVKITGLMKLPATTTATSGIIYKGSNRFLHSFYKAGTTGRNLFLGEYSGNLSLTGSSSGQQGSYLLGIGTYALQANTVGYQNIGIGDNALAFNTSGYQNISIGTEAGKNITTGYACVAIGHGAMTYSSDSAVTNVAVGNSSLSKSNRACNVAVGSSALMELTLGLDCIGIGTGAGLNRNRGTGNIAIGVYSQGRHSMATETIDGDGNNSIGSYSLAALTTGDFNTVVGDSAGYTITTGSNNILIGNKAAFSSNFSNRLVVDNTKRGSAALDTTSALIYGNFSLPRLTVNGQFWVNVGGERYFHNFSAAGTSGRNNFIGLYAGNKTLTGSDAGDEGSYNNGFGQYALSSLTVGRDNTAIGEQTNYNATTGSYNVSIGNYSMKNNLTSSNNTAVGYQAHQGGSTPANNIGIGNVAFGDRALTAVTSADYTTAVGQFAGTAITSGDNNTLLGRMAGYSLTTGAGNVFLGYSAGYNETGSNKLYVDNSNTTTPLIYGEFDNDIVRVNGAFVQAFGTIADNDATPDVSANNVWKYNGTANSVTVTDLDNPDVGATYTIIGNSDTYTVTIADSGNFKLSGASAVLGVDDVLILYCLADNYYIELSRSDN